VWVDWKSTVVISHTNHAMKTYRYNSYARFSNLQTLHQELVASKRATPLITNAVSSDNDYEASSFFATLLRIAGSCRVDPNRKGAAEFLQKAKSGVTIENLEARFWVRFVFGRLHVPQGVRAELLRLDRNRAKREKEATDNQTSQPPSPDGAGKQNISPNVETLTEEEAAALRLLIAAVNDDGASYWVATEDMDRIHKQHADAHPRTPPLISLIEKKVISPHRCHDTGGYFLTLRFWGQESNKLIPGAILGLLWEELTRDQTISSDKERLSKWLAGATQMNSMIDAPAHITPELRKRLLDASLSVILEEPDIVDRENECERLRWEFDGCFRGTLAVKPIPDSEDSLLSLYLWWKQPTFGYLLFLREASSTPLLRS
jgi:hypothetical protein